MNTVKNKIGRCGERACGYNCGMCDKPTFHIEIKEGNSYMGYSWDWIKEQAIKNNMSVEQYICYWETTGLTPGSYIE